VLIRSILLRERLNYGRLLLQILAGDAILDKEVKSMGIRMKRKIAGSMAILLLAGMLAGCNGEEAQETASEEMQSPVVDIEIQKQQKEAAQVDPMADLLKDHYEFIRKGNGRRDCLCVRRCGHGRKL
jgi:Trm5-related predicted tRNA methylase